MYNDSKTGAESGQLLLSFSPFMMSDDEDKIDDPNEKGGSDINLSGRELTDLPKAFVDLNGETVTRLDLTENNIKSGSSFGGLAALETLILDKNGREGRRRRT
eukprot:g64130.t1